MSEDISISSLVLALPKPFDNRPVLIAVSGFGGSGKSTLAQKLKENLKEAEIISIDDFIIDRLSQRSDEWLGFDRERLKKSILEPAIRNAPLIWDEYNWKENKIIGKKEIDKLPKYLILEGCSLLHPDLMPFYDFTIWIDIPLELATERGAARDRSWGLDHDNLWNNLWKPNEADFFKKYHPERQASFVYRV
jgi:uridine kinase